MRWFGRAGQKGRIEESRERMRETEITHARVRRQWPEVRHLSREARKQRESNHLTELFLAIHREK